MRCIAVVLLILMATETAFGDSESIGSDGIKSISLGLTGSGVPIGQIEPGRPGKPMKDDPIRVHEQTIPTQVYSASGVDGANSALVMSQIGIHATEVAGVMIAKAAPITLVRGVAPDANLYSVGDTGGGDDTTFAAAANRIATLPEDLVAINVSEGRFLEEGEALNGNTHMTQYIDWSASANDILYAVAGWEDMFKVDIPGDNFNGITVAASWKARDDMGIPVGPFRQIAGFSVGGGDAVGDRTSIDILAPGENILLTSPNNLELVRSGTSFAAPHVTGTVALLQQHAATQINASEPRWVDPNARHHQVMKAILLNSADKLPNVHGSTREVINNDGQNWLMTTAGTSPFTSLDEQIGAGHLNASSALINYEPGEYDPGDVPRVGWDWGDVPGFGGQRDYVFDEQVSGYVAVTLAWDRRLAKTGDEDSYAAGDQFFNAGLVDLDLYLLPAGTDDLNMAVSRSVTTDDNLEHIFFNIEQPGNYKIKVVNAGGLEDDQDYGLAWWAGEFAAIPGDFDSSGTVDGLDLAQWKGDFAMNGESDADNDGDSDGNDFLVWQQNLGMSNVTPTTAVVPEPGAWLLAIIGLPLMTRRRRGNTARAMH